MVKYHIVPKSGEVRTCNAKKEPCPYGGASGLENHFDTHDEAKAAYESLMKSIEVPKSLSRANTISSIDLSVERAELELSPELSDKDIEYVLNSMKKFAKDFPILWTSPNKIKIPKRGKQREALSDSKNLFMRAKLDYFFPIKKDNEEEKHKLTESWRFAVKLFGGNCYICDKPLYNQDGTNMGAQADHIYPPEKGGTISPGNMGPSHSLCNNAKSDSTPEEYFKDKPETLKKIKIFQKRFEYEPPRLEIFIAVRQKLEEEWASFNNQLDDEVKEMLEKYSNEMEDSNID